MKKYDLKKLPDARRKRKYPWHELPSKGCFFVWSNLSDRYSIYASAKTQGMKVSCKTVDNELHVIRVD